MFALIRFLVSFISSFQNFFYSVYMTPRKQAPPPVYKPTQTLYEVI